MCLNVIANGLDDGKGTHVSVYACLMRGKFDDTLKWPFQDHVTIAMLNQLEGNNHTTELSDLLRQQIAKPLVE